MVVEFSLHISLSGNLENKTPAAIQLICCKRQSNPYIWPLPWSLQRQYGRNQKVKQLFSQTAVKAEADAERLTQILETSLFPCWLCSSLWGWLFEFWSASNFCCDGNLVFFAACWVGVRMDVIWRRRQLCVIFTQQFCENGCFSNGAIGLVSLRSPLSHR